MTFEAHKDLFGAFSSVQKELPKKLDDSSTNEKSPLSETEGNGTKKQQMHHSSSETISDTRPLREQFTGSYNSKEFSSIDCQINKLGCMILLTNVFANSLFVVVHAHYFLDCWSIRNVTLISTLAMLPPISACCFAGASSKLKAPCLAATLFTLGTAVSIFNAVAFTYQMVHCQ